MIHLINHRAETATPENIHNALTPDPGQARTTIITGVAGVPLDRIRTTTWNDELLDLLRILTLIMKHGAVQQEILDRILNAELIDADQLPESSAASRKVPKNNQAGSFPGYDYLAASRQAVLVNDLG
ncbi:hypothetical protein [Corynebacterium casei]|uniref:Uncharacterized protein n=1 Tax=Corynebacterium casei LMG S-19264 TaxID=1285583 RepID=A0ABN4CAF9_9CORY|nr:hypothetical protein [Corynebacterium casei]AHI19367.1 hypothetical protein CCASEI_03945 [Corynebacterium casei LMG S-19264]